MVPTKERNVTGIFLSYKDKGILFDCGEGTQRQMNIAGINRNKVNYIFISHWHGDHVSGLIGLIQTLGNQSFESEYDRKTLHIYGPKETEQRIEHMLQTCIFDQRINLEVHEIIPKRNEILTILDTEDFYIQAASLDHGVPCLAYAFIEKDIRKIDPKKMRELGLKEGPMIGNLQRGEDVQVNGNTITAEMVSYVQKGRKLSIVLDTGVCDNAYKISEDADLLICEAAYASKLEEKADDHKHMTAKQAALIANNANVQRLILTHLSQRYKTGEEVLEDARDIFSNVDVAYDFMKVKL